MTDPPVRTADPLVADVGVDPFDALDTEAARIDRFYTALDGAGWSAPTRCAGWDRRDLLAHLDALEDYVRAGLDGTVSRGGGQDGDGTLDEHNAAGIARRADLSREELLGHWRQVSAANRRELRRRGPDATIDTSVGDYPLGRQAYYLASELATHADDAGVPIPVEDRAARIRWRARFARAALAESGVEVTGDDDAVVVRPSGVRLSAADLVEAVADRLPDDVPVPPDVRRALVVLA
jgi:uncharacterized protein (TIGR03083 family)